jgi:hypothetical protein
MNTTSMLHLVDADIDLALVPGAMQTVLTRRLDNGGLIRFEEAPKGWLLENGDERRKDHRAYYWTPQDACAACGGDGKANGKTRVVKCKACAGTGETKRARMTSVSSILADILPKGGLPHWAEERGIEGTILAIQEGKLDLLCTPEQAIARVRELGLGAEGARDEAAGRGLDIHGLLSDYMETGSLPSSERVHPDDIGYYQALCKFLAAENPEPEQVEELVCDPTEGYAGRCDLVGRAGGFRKRWDAKTSEKLQIYPGAHVQVGLYENAGRVCGDEPNDLLEVVAFAADGNWRPMPVAATNKTLTAALNWWREVRPLNSVCESANRIEKEARQ